MPSGRAAWLSLLIGVLLVLLAAGVIGIRHLSSFQVGFEKVPEATLLPRACGYFPRYGIDLQCYWYRSPEGFRLPVAVFSHEDNRQRDPLVYLAGGPGESRNMDPGGLGFWNSWYNNAQIDRDFIVFDYRGAALGEPTWECRSFIELSKQGMMVQSSLEESQEWALKELGRCVKDWDSSLRRRLAITVPAGEVSRLFSSRHNAGDANGIAHALGYSQWNFLGVSYGTRVALLAAMDEPRVRRVILDSPYPLQVGDLVESTRVWIEAFEHFWRACNAGEVCAKGNETDAKTAFWKAMELLRETPLELRLEDWYSAGTVDLIVDDLKFMHVIYSAMHSQESYQKIKPVIDDVLAGQAVRHREIFENFYNFSFDPSFNSMLYFATECTDNRRVPEEEFEALLPDAGAWRRYISLDWRYDICRHDFFEPIPLPPMGLIKIPALVVVGERDPVTPLRHAQLLRRHLPHAMHLQLPRRSHAEFFNEDCGFEMIQWFLDEPIQSPESSEIPMVGACH